jgi:hypothetical protein
MELMEEIFKTLNMIHPKKVPIKPYLSALITLATSLAVTIDCIFNLGCGDKL